MSTHCRGASGSRASTRAPAPCRAVTSFPWCVSSGPARQSGDIEFDTYVTVPLFAYSFSWNHSYSSIAIVRQTSIIITAASFLDCTPRNHRFDFPSTSQPSRTLTSLSQVGIAYSRHRLRLLGLRERLQDLFLPLVLQRLVQHELVGDLDLRDSNRKLLQNSCARWPPRRSRRCAEDP